MTAFVPCFFGEAVLLPNGAHLTFAESRVAQYPLAIFESADDYEAQRAAMRRRVLADRRVARVGIRLAFLGKEDLGEERIRVDRRRVSHGGSLAFRLPG